MICGYEGSKPRQVLVTEGDLPRVLAALEGARERGGAVDARAGAGARRRARRVTVSARTAAAGSPTARR